MIVLDCEQNSDEWMRARLGIPTASCFDKICTSTGKPSTQAQAYMNKLLAEWLLDMPTEGYRNSSMDRGHELEDEARAYYEFDTGTELTRVGLCYRDDKRLIGASPDALIGDDGGLEIKCPLPHTHVGYLLADKIPSTYYVQVQGSLLVTGRSWWEFLSYCPGLPEKLIRVERDEPFLTALTTLLDKFVVKLLSKRAELAERGYKEAA